MYNEFKDALNTSFDHWELFKEHLVGFEEVEDFLKTRFYGNNERLQKEKAQRLASLKSIEKIFESMKRAVSRFDDMKACIEALRDGVRCL